MTTVNNRLFQTAIAFGALLNVFAIGSAHAVGTDAGSAVSNTFTLNYDVNSVPQTEVNNTGTPTTFTVDRLVNVTVTSQGNLTVTPGATGQELVYGVLNTGNDNQAYDFALEDPAGDTFDATGLTVRFYVDAGGDGIFTPGVDDAGAGTPYTLGTASADLAPDATLWIVISGDIPVAATNGQTDAITLIADSLNPVTSLDPGYTATPGDETVAEVGANNVTGEAQNVLADAAGPATTDNANDGASSDTGNFDVGAAALTANKTVTVLATDGAAFGCGVFTNTQIDLQQFAVPGACVEYVISATNAASASQPASNIDISDFLPDGVVFVGAEQSDFSTAGVLTEPVASCTPDPVGLPIVTCEVRLDDAVLNINTTGTLVIRATVD